MDTVEWIKVGGVLVSILVFLWTIFQFMVSKRIEAKRPYLEYQLSLYQRTIKLAAQIGVTIDSSEREKLILEFQTLYYGELGLVESFDVEEKLVEFYNDMRANDEYLRTKALELASVMRKELAKSWNVSNWQPIRKSLIKRSS